MLRTDTKSTNMQVTSIIDGVELASFSANVTSEGEPAAVYQSIINQDKYLENRDAVRNDLTEFQSMMFDAQDALLEQVKMSTAKFVKEE